MTVAYKNQSDALFSSPCPASPPYPILLRHPRVFLRLSSGGNHIPACSKARQSLLNGVRLVCQFLPGVSYW